MNKPTNNITLNDINILQLINQFGWLREDLIARFLKLDWTLPTTKTKLTNLSKRLIQAHIIKRNNILSDKPSYWGLATQGASLINSTPVKPIALMTIVHNDLVATLAIDHLMNKPDIPYITEHTIKCQALHPTMHTIPDLIIHNDIAIEVELTQKSTNRLGIIIANYIASHYSQIIYYTNKPAIAKRIKLLSQHHPKFTCKIFDQDLILQATDYVPNNSPNNPTNTGQYSSLHEERLRQIGFR